MTNNKIFTELRFLVVLILAFLTSRTKGHLCISDPPQRLNTGDQLYIDCYQDGHPPCGIDFPTNMTKKPTTVLAGQMLPVLLSMPITHYNPKIPGSIKINIFEDELGQSTNLADERDGTEKQMTLNVRIPEREGLHILQAIYKAPGYEFFSCSDIYVNKPQSVPKNEPMDSTPRSNVPISTRSNKVKTEEVPTRDTSLFKESTPTSDAESPTFQGNTGGDGNSGSKLQIFYGFNCFGITIFMMILRTFIFL